MNDFESELNKKQKIYIPMSTLIHSGTIFSLSSLVIKDVLYNSIILVVITWKFV